MVKYENECVGPCPMGCMGSSCPNRNVERHYCDKCGDELGKKIYLVDDEELCEWCLKDRFLKCD